MDRRDIRPGMLLRNTQTGDIGVPLTGYDFGVIDHETEIGVVYRGTKSSQAPAFDGTPFALLEPYRPKTGDLLTEEHVKSVCKPGKGNKTCRYLTAGSDGFECAKVSGDPGTARMMDERVEKKEAAARGNNCNGKYKS